MAEKIAVVGGSGKGKSTSILPNDEIGIKGLNPKETVLVNVTGKSLPTRGWKKYFKEGIKAGGNYVVTDDYQLIIDMMVYVDEKRPDIKNIVIDDAQYLMAFAFMARTKQKGYDKFNEIADFGFLPIEAVRNLKRSDLTIFFLYHDEEDANGERKIKTSGKMLDKHITLEGLFTIVLYSQAFKSTGDKMDYRFLTNNDGTCSAKSPYGMFDTYIPNDLGYVMSKVNTYYQ